MESNESTIVEGSVSEIVGQTFFGPSNKHGMIVEFGAASPATFRSVAIPAGLGGKLSLSSLMRTSACVMKHAGLRCSNMPEAIIMKTMLIIARNDIYFSASSEQYIHRLSRRLKLMLGLNW